MLRNRYILLFLTVLAHMVALTLDLPSPWKNVINLLVAPLLAALLASITRRRRDLWIALFLAGASSAIDLVIPWRDAPLALNLVKVALWCLAPAYVAVRLFVTVYRSVAVSYGEISAAVTVYLLIASVYANLFEALYLLDPTCLRFGDSFAVGHIDFGDILYFSYITLSTLGYGDVAPGHPITRAVAVTESVTGVMYVAILVARFVSLHSAQQLQRKI